MMNFLRQRFGPISRPLMISAVLHVLVLVLSIVSITLFPTEIPPPEETPIVVDLVQVAERTAAPPPGMKSKDLTPRPEVKKPDPVKEEPKPEPAKPEPPKPEPPKPEPPKPPQPKEPPPPPKEQPKPEPVKPEPPKPEPPKKEPEKAEKAPDAPPKPEPKKEEPKKEEPKKEEPKKVEPKKEEPKKEEPKKETPKETSKDSKQKTDDDPFKDLMKNVEKFRQPNTPQSAPQTPTQQPATAQPQQAGAGGPRILNAPIAAQATMSEMDAIRAQVESNWLIDTGAQGADKMVIVLRVSINPDGSVVDVRVDSQSWSQYNSDRAFQAMTDSAIRAVRKSSPLKYPQEKYETFKTMVLSFRPQSRM